MTETAVESLVRQLADGRFHSGESLAALLGVSRTAVWKRMQKISHDTGLEIHAVRGKGYRLALPLELLDADSIAGHISSGLSRGAEVEVHSSLPSTSNHLAERLGELPDNTLCFAEHQTAGRGRRGRQWISPYGTNLYFSLYRRFPLGMHELAGLSLAVGAVLAETLSQYVDGISLKWPNDLLIDGRKLAGVLVDVHGLAEGPVDTIIGIGLNLRMSQLPGDEIDQPWIDLESVAGREFSRNRLAAELSLALLEALETFSGSRLSTWMESWRRYDNWHGRQVQLVRGESVISGVHAGVANDGSLRLKIDGRVEHFHSGEVTLREGVSSEPV
ncbi:MAG: bifunctional biotin--[acetyl-CoA-carboxylase] ligase/biotin operon repressor BirA [Chromatiales bacterium]|jgi:BirA family biotin operon repressor/biotin-[acetyl-CoA-carboxylase] ligase